MTRKNIFEILEENYDIIHEFLVIENLFFSPTIMEYGRYCDGDTIPVEQAVDRHCFYSWKQRGSCLTTNDLKQKLNIEVDSNPSLEQIILNLEYFCNILYLVNTKLLPPHFAKTQKFVMLEQNIAILLTHLNHERQIFQDEEKILLIPKDPAATAVAEISSKESANAILKYHHASLKGQLEEKRKLLLTIAKEYEPLLDKGIDEFTSYFTTVRGMINNAHIRHNNKEGADKKEIIAKMSDDELENLYDEIYQLLLFCVLAKDNKERKNKMSEFLKGLKEKK